MATTTTAAAAAHAALSSDDASAAAPSTEETPISPIAHRTSFPHRTIAAAAVHPFIDTATPAINTVPVELDGTPTSPDTRKAQGDDADDDEDEDAGKGRIGRRGSRGPGGEVFSPGAHDEVMEELSGMRGQGSREREKRAAMLSSRSKDPAVLVDIPTTPAADELEIASRSVHEGKPIDKDDNGEDEDEEEAKDES